MGQFRLSEALKDLYRFIWDDFCSWYLELVKPVYGRPIDQQTYDRTVDFFSDLMSMLHPFMPFVTEEIWHLLRVRLEGEDCMITPLKIYKRAHPAVTGDMALLNKMVTAIRELRAEKQIALKDTLQVWWEASTKANDLFSQAGTTALVMKMANLSALEQTAQEQVGCVTLMADTEKLFIAYEAEINIEEEREKLQKELEYYSGFVKSISGKLSNERFVSGAPADVVDRERQKLADSETKIKAIEESLSRLNYSKPVISEVREPNDKLIKRDKIKRPDQNWPGRF
jgi:valyl-tRNA synthetase